MLIGRCAVCGHVALALAVSATATGLAVGSARSASTAISANQAVPVVLNEWTLKPARTVVRAGRVTFVIRNDGTLLHELVVLRSDRRPANLPLRRGRALEMGRRGELNRIASGTTRRLSLKLPVGRYVLICNLLGHYQAGQFAALRVR